MHSSLHQNCHHQLIFAKVNMKIFYPPPYKLWFGITATPIMKHSNRENAFDGKDIHAQFALFNETLLNIFSNFTPNRTKSFTDSDAPWITEDIKNKINLKNKFCRLLSSERRKSSKEKYYQRINAKVNDSLKTLLSNKTYWSILKIFSIVRNFVSYLRSLLTINLLLVFKKKRMFLTLILQNNTRRFQGVVPCLRKHCI